MIKNHIEKIGFFILNIILSSGLLQASTLLIISLLLNPNGKYAWDINRDDDIWTALVIFLLLVPIVWLIKINIFQVFYKNFKKLTYVQNYLSVFLTNKERQQKILICSFIADLLMMLLPYFIFMIFTSHAFNFNDFKEYIFIALIVTLLMGGGVFTSYLSLLVWQWLENRKNKNEIKI